VEEFSLFAYSIMFLVSFITAAISAATGMGGGVIFLIGLNQFIPLKSAIPIHGLIQLKNNALRVHALRQFLIKKMCVIYSLGCTLGVIVVALMIKNVESKLIPLILIFLLVAYSLFKPKKLPHIKIPDWGYGPLGFATGVLGILIGAVDPLLAPFFLRDDLNRQQVIANKSFFQMLIHFFKIPVFLYLGFQYLNYLPLIVVLFIGGVLGTYGGIAVLHKISQEVFIKVFKGILFLVWLKVLYNIINLI
jgi:uncharacterized membrane protein YfcA